MIKRRKCSTTKKSLIEKKPCVLVNPRKKRSSLSGSKEDVAHNPPSSPPSSLPSSLFACASGAADHNVRTIFIDPSAKALPFTNSLAKDYDLPTAGIRTPAFSPEAVLSHNRGADEQPVWVWDRRTMQLIRIGKYNIIPVLLYFGSQCLSKQSVQQRQLLWNDVMKLIRERVLPLALHKKSCPPSNIRPPSKRLWIVDAAPTSFHHNVNFSSFQRYPCKKNISSSTVFE